MADNYWLYEQLKDKHWLEVGSPSGELLHVRHEEQSYAIYVPDGDEYVITTDLVQKVQELGGDTISFPSSWCRAAREAVEYGKKHGVRVVPHGQLFGILKCR